MSAYDLTVYRGIFIHLPRIADHSTTKPQLVRHRGALWVSTSNGRIKGFDWSAQDDESFRDLMVRNNWTTADVRTDLNGDHEPMIKVKIVRTREDRNEFFFPGFIDTHIHAPQYPNAGLFGSTTLLDWLESYTFPVESGFGDQGNPRQEKTSPQDAPPVALRVYNQVICRTLSHGTTCASYFATIHTPATNALASLCHARGQRAFIGRVCMDNPFICPSYYRDHSPEDSLSATEATIAYIHTLDPKGTLVKPIITPRFAPTCSPAALNALGSLAASYNPPLHIQTHISENTNEIALVKDLFPNSESYASVYDTHNLLTRRTILAHAVHLSPSERSLIATRQAKVSHCPASNAALGSGICPVRTLLNDGITVGPGTDVSGGYSPSILEAARQACLSSRLLGHTSSFAASAGPGITGDVTQEKPVGYEKLSVDESLYLATRGGAAVVDMADELGGFEEGMLWDAQLIELGAVRESVEGLLEGSEGGWQWVGGECRSVWDGDLAGEDSEVGVEWR
ncbi:guanine deaminase [Penicillium chermesinum]|nr:guanine deaminase [Penicillium chermesinum]